MKNLFFVPFAFTSDKMTGVNVREDALNVYLKNLCVSLISAKKATPNIDVALVSNINIPTEQEKLLLENDVLILGWNAAVLLSELLLWIWGQFP